MDKTETLYFFEIKHPIVVESDYSWIIGAFYKVAIQAKDWMINWEYADAVLDVVQFMCSW